MHRTSFESTALIRQTERCYRRHILFRKMTREAGYDNCSTVCLTYSFTSEGRLCKGIEKGTQKLQKNDPIDTRKPGE